MGKRRFNSYHPTVRKAREEAIKRSEGWCQFCGLEKAEEGHHWRGYAGGDYLPEEKTTADEFIGLCYSCHKIATAIRRRSGFLMKKEKLLNERERRLRAYTKIDFLLINRSWQPTLPSPIDSQPNPNCRPVEIIFV